MSVRSQPEVHHLLREQWSASDGEKSMMNRVRSQIIA
jgi:hypothetical protein